METLVFDINASFGHFKVPYTTTSPLTFPIPPKTSVAGMVSCIIGLDKTDYLNYFNQDDFKIAIEILKPIKMIIINENFINVKNVKYFARMPKGKSCRTQINIEFLKDPSYRIYLYHKNDKVFKELQNNLREHKSIYTFCMGLSECIGNFIYIGKFISQMVVGNNSFIELSSVLPLSQIDKSTIAFNTNENKKYIKIHLPTHINNNRELVSSDEIIIERDGKSMDVKLNMFWKIDINGSEKNVLFF